MTPRCPYCLDDMLPDQDTVRCTACRTPHHKVCFDENEGCVSYGCMGNEDVSAGLSIFAKAAITISHRASHHVELGPFMFGFKRLPPVPETRPSWRCPQPYARLGFESREVREGDLLRGKGVIYVPTVTTFKRIELNLLQSIGRPVELETVFLTDEEGRLFGSSPSLSAGSHPFYLQLRAPQNTPPVDPFLLELVLSQSLFKEVRSTRLPLFLLQHQPETRPRSEPPPIPIRLQASRRPQRELPAAASDGAAHPWAATPGPLAPGDQAPEPEPFNAAPAADPFARPDDPFARPADPFARPDAADPPTEGRPGTARLGPDQLTPWQEIPARVAGSAEEVEPLRARHARAESVADGELDLSLPRLLQAPEFEFTVHGAAGMRSLNLAVHAELVRPGGSGGIAWDCFPQLVESRLVSSEGLASPAPHEVLEVQLRIPPQQVWALAQARQAIAHNAALRLRLALDGLDAQGDRVRGPTRSVTYTG